jgi:hypothetical protein
MVEGVVGFSPHRVFRLVGGDVNREMSWASQHDEELYCINRIWRLGGELSMMQIIPGL